MKRFGYFFSVCEHLYEHSPYKICENISTSKKWSKFSRQYNRILVRNGCLSGSTARFLAIFYVAAAAFKKKICDIVSTLQVFRSIFFDYPS